MANGLDEARALQHAPAVRALNGRATSGASLCWPASSATSRGRPLDLAVDCLAQLDFVVASIHSAIDLGESR